MLSDPAQSKPYCARTAFAGFIVSDDMEAAHSSQLSPASLDVFEGVILDMMDVHQHLDTLTRTQRAEVGVLRRMTRWLMLFNGFVVTFLTALHLRGSVIISPNFHLSAIAAVFIISALSIYRFLKFSRNVAALEDSFKIAQAKYNHELAQAKAALHLEPAEFTQFIEIVRANLDKVMSRYKLSH